MSRGTGILRNELYVDPLIWNRSRYCKDPLTGRRVARLNPARNGSVEASPNSDLSTTISGIACRRD